MASVTGLISFVTGDSLPQMIGLGSPPPTHLPAGGHGARHSRQPVSRTSVPATHSARPITPKPRPGVSSPAPVNNAAETLSDTIAPDSLTNTGSDIRVRVTVTGATPGGQVTWEEDARGTASDPGTYPGEIPCLISGQGGWCGVDIRHGVVTANSDGVATFDVAFVPGQVYDDLNAQGVSDFADVFWEVTVWDDATYNQGNAQAADRTASAGSDIDTATDAPLPADWSRS
jgi:hypothetical protein